MLRLFAPAGVAVLAIVSLTVWSWAYSDIFGGSAISPEELDQRFASVPMTVGPWVGTDMTPEAATLEQAGAVSYVSRRYVNSESNESVDLWLIVGHSRDICRHTPDICYPSQGFSQVSARVKWPFETTDGAENPPTFFTAKFRNESEAGSRDARVFWAWTTDVEGQDTWDAPEPKTWFDWLPGKSTGPKVYYGNNSSLYKLYFTATMTETDEDVANNVVNDFAEVMLPEIDRALFPERFPNETKAKKAAAEPVTAEVPAAAN